MNLWEKRGQLIGKLFDQSVVTRVPDGKLLEKITFRLHDRTGIGIIEFIGSETVRDQIGGLAIVQAGFPDIKLIPLVGWQLVIDVSDKVDRIIMLAFKIIGRNGGRVKGMLKRCARRQGPDVIAGRRRESFMKSNATLARREKRI